MAVAALATAAGAGAVDLDIKFIFLVGVQLVTFGALWGGMRANARHMRKEIHELKEDVKTEVFPRLRNIEIKQARDEGRTNIHNRRDT